MRVTSNNMMNSYLKDVQKNLQGMNKINNQISTGNQVNKVSDDPLKAVKIMNLNNEISDIERYNSNVDEVNGWLDMTDNALDKVGTLSSEIKTLLTSISGTFGKDEMKAVSSEVNEKIKQIGEAFNTSYGGKYIFGGSITDEPPVKVNVDENDGTVSLVFRNTNDEGKPNKGLSDNLNVSVSNGINFNYNLNLIVVSNSGDAFDIFEEVSDALKGDTADFEKLGELSKKLDSYLSDILNQRSVVGARSNTIQTIKNTNEENKIEMKGVLSNIQDVDVADAFIKYKSAEMVYTASLQVTAKIFNNTILDYLR